ncbi:hypothetical protein [Pseudomonas aeruginosa]|uniref:hypothetical protein n=1 Tax=Pseudomonas aeruginosa TaxID=287 RepID=UPI001BC94188|nr:hypothetical protein [Pseudomonas aeruginosa]
MDEPLFNELLESVKQADQIMTDHAELRRLAKAAHPDAEWFMARNLDHPNIDKPAASFIAAASPKTILALLDEIDWLRSRLEIDERTPHDGIACRDETIKVLDEKCDRLKAENEALRGALKPFAEFERVRSAMGGNAPREGILYGVHSNTGSAELHVEHMQAAQSALEGATQ